MIPGIDASHWQKTIDWSLVKRSGVRFAFIKATEFPDKQTKLWTDPNFKPLKYFQRIKYVLLT